MGKSSRWGDSTLDDLEGRVMLRTGSHPPASRGAFEMKTVASWNDLESFGIIPLTGEACGLMWRILLDVTEKGRRVVGKCFGVPKIVLAEPWNRGTSDEPHVGSIMLTGEALVPLAVFALLENGCKEVWLVRDGGVIGIEPDDAPEIVEANRIMLGDRFRRSLGYRGTAGDRNVHVMSGRVE
jgi:hypothetical protein